MERISFAEVVRFAIEKEIEAHDFYVAASETVRRANVKEMLLDLARQEDGHRRRLEGLDPARMPEAGAKPVPDLKIADQMDNDEVTPDTDYQEVLTIAMKREEKAHNLYSILASNSTEPELKELFEVLARDEARHKLALEKEYDEHVLTDN